jgi:FAD binding domain
VDAEVKSASRVRMSSPDLEVCNLDVAWTSSDTWIIRVADSFRAGRALLVDDAAHLMPLAGRHGGNAAVLDGWHPSEVDHLMTRSAPVIAHRQQAKLGGQGDIDHVRKVRVGPRTLERGRFSQNRNRLNTRRWFSQPGENSPTGVVKSRLGQSNWWGIPHTHPLEHACGRPCSPTRGEASQ